MLRFLCGAASRLEQETLAERGALTGEIHGQGWPAHFRVMKSAAKRREPRS
jgi:hypothetical protein